MIAPKELLCCEVKGLDEKWTNNVVELTGTLGGRPIFSHVSREESYYVFPLEVRRLSGVADTLNIMARQKLLGQMELESLPKITVRGELRSFNNKTGNGNRLVITVFARSIMLCDGPDANHATLRGVICKPPNLRQTPMGREICDLMLAINRRYGRSDYLPCITWGKNAIEAGKWSVGTAVEFTGRAQSRTYIKQEDGHVTEKTAFEVSVVAQALA